MYAGMSDWTNPVGISPCDHAAQLTYTIGKNAGSPSNRGTYHRMEDFGTSYNFGGYSEED